jgi:RNA polymerase sigma-70 factor, ECF subfamily
LDEAVWQLLPDCDVAGGERDLRWSQYIHQQALGETHMIAATATVTASTNTSIGTSPVILGWHDLIEHRDYLIRFVGRKLHDAAQAEDLVHDVFEAVVTGRAVFEGRSSLRSWLTGILKFKLVDLIRQRARYDSFDGAGWDDEDSGASFTDMLECPNAGPEELAEQRELLTQTLRRIDALPPGLREVMLFRILHEEPSATVCKRLGITETSLFVRLHRARKQLLC